jgi:hypothetical protein
VLNKYLKADLLIIDGYSDFFGTQESLARKISSSETLPARIVVALAIAFFATKALHETSITPVLLPN